MSNLISKKEYVPFEKVIKMPLQLHKIPLLFGSTKTFVYSFKKTKILRLLMKSETEVVSGCFLWKSLRLELRPLLPVIFKKRAPLVLGHWFNTHSEKWAAFPESPMHFHRTWLSPGGCPSTHRQHWQCAEVRKPDKPQLAGKQAFGLKNIKRN